MTDGTPTEEPLENTTVRNVSAHGGGASGCGAGVCRRAGRAPRMGAAGLCLLAACVLAASPSVARAPLFVVGGRVSSSAGRSAAAKAVPLVNADDELASALSKAETLIKKKDYETAIELLRVLVDRTEGSGVVRIAGGRLYVSLRIKANEVIGRMGPDGLKAYRRLFDPEARQWYEQAMATGETSLLRRIADRRLHTSYGLRALGALGSIHFDRAQFVQAGRYWSRVVAMGKAGQAEPLLLAKLAAAQYLSGDSRRGAKTLETLRKKHPGAKWALGGRRRDLAAFVDEVRKLAPEQSGPRPAFREHWPGLGGIPDGMARMAESEVVLAARWRHPEGTGQSDLAVDVVVSAHTLNPSGVRGVQFPTRLRDGHVEIVPAAAVTASRSRSSVRTAGGRYTLPAFVHPVIVGDVVYYRRDDAVVGCDMVTGQEQCRADRLPVFRALRLSTAHYGYGSYGVKAADGGRYTLTVGGGKMFAVANFRQGVRIHPRRMPRTVGDKRNLADTSELLALSIPGQLKLLWRVGRQAGDDETVRNGKFLCAPMYDNGRLYVLATHIESYYLLCLDAEGGKLIWKTSVSQTPTLSQRPGYAMDALLHRGSPPALADGRVFVTTNGGVVAAFDAGTGQVIWAYQYKSHYDTYGSASARVIYHPSSGIGIGYPVNPVIVTGGRVVCLPTDSEELLVLSAEDGRLLASHDRRSQADLSAVDSRRVALSGPGLILVALAGGSDEAYPVQGVAGRPAVTPGAILASGRGRIFRLDLQTDTVTTTPRSGGEEVPGLLGALVSVRGLLIAANSAGICSYMSYEQARTWLSERLAEAVSPQDRAPLLLRRGQFAFNLPTGQAGGKRFADALDDLLAAEQLTRLHPDLQPEMVALRSLIHRAYVALGNSVHRDSSRMAELFVKAEAYAKTVQEKAHMRLRIAKAHAMTGRRLAAEAKRRERAGDSGAAEVRRRMLAALVLAVKTAQELAEDQDFAKEELVDVAVGAGADESVRFGPDVVRRPARTLVHKFIDALIDEFGRECYEAFDAKATAALEQARARKEPEAMVAVADRWPNSIWADDARFAAAEVYCRRGREAGDEGADGMHARAIRQLEHVVFGTQDKQMRLSAHVGLAAIYALDGGRYITGDHCDQARELATDEAGTFRDARVAFAEHRGLLSEVLKKVQGELSGRPRRRLPYFAVINPPLHKVFSFAEKDLWIVRDQDYRPIRMGQRIVALRGDRLVMINTSSRKLDDAIAWVGLTGIDVASLRRQAVMPMRLVGGLSEDEAVLAVADRQTLRGFDMRTAKAKWTHTMAEIGISSLAQMGVGGGVLVAADNGGRIVCIDLGTGEERWSSGIPRGRSRRPSSPPPSRSPSSPPVIQQGLVFLRHDVHKALVCLDLKSGSLVRQWGGATQSRVAFADSGLLVVLVDGKLAAFDPTQMSKPLWERNYSGKAYPGVLAVSRDFVAVSPSRASDMVEVLAMAGGRKVADLSIVATRREQPGWPVDAHFDGKSLYVVCSVGRPTGPRQNKLGRLSQTYGMVLQKFTIGRDSRPAWRFVADPNPKSIALSLPLSIGRRHVVLTVKSHSAVGKTAAFVLDADNGKQVGQFDLVSDKRSLAQLRSQLYSVGPPVMTNGHLCVETAEGMTIYGD